MSVSVPRVALGECSILGILGKSAFITLLDLSVSDDHYHPHIILSSHLRLESRHTNKVGPAEGDQLRLLADLQA